MARIGDHDDGDALAELLPKLVRRRTRLEGIFFRLKVEQGRFSCDHHSSCRVARPAANWLAFTSGYQPFSHAFASLPGAKNVERRYFRRSASGSARSALFVTASESAFG